MSVVNKNCKNFVKMQTSCDSSTESDRQEHCWESKSLYPVLSRSSIYYEENQLFCELEGPDLSPVESVFSKSPSSHFVEIHEELSTSIDLPPISWYGYNSVPKIISATNTGRIILISGQWTHTKPYITGGPLNGSYIFSQIHFHSPSEHEIDGKRYPLEMHVVHYKTCYLTQERAMEEKDGTVVLVYLFQVKNNASDTALSFVSKLGPKITKVNSQVEITNVKLDQIVKPFTSNYYIYWGSVSTVKNSYVLQWVINCSSLYVSQQEIDDLLAIMGSNAFVTEHHAPQMKPVNNAIFYVENYCAPNGTKEKVTTCKMCHAHLVPSSYHTTCKSCSMHKGACPSQAHSHVLDSKGLQEKKDVQLQTSSRDKTVTVKLTPIVYDDKPKEKESIEAVGPPVVLSCTTCKTVSQTSVKEDVKKKKKKTKESKKVASCSSVSTTVSEHSGKNSDENIEICQVKKLSSHSSVKVCTSSSGRDETEKGAAKQEENPFSNCQLTKKDEQKMANETSAAACDSSKTSVRGGEKTKKKNKKDSEKNESFCDKAKSSSHECQCQESKRSTQKSESEPCDYTSENSKSSSSKSKPKKKKAKKQKSDTDSSISESGSSKSSICDEKKKGKKEKKEKKPKKEKKEKKPKKEKKEKKPKKEKVKKKKSKHDTSETTSASSCVLVCCDEELPKKNEMKNSEELECNLKLCELEDNGHKNVKEEEDNGISRTQNNIQCMPALGLAVMAPETLNKFENTSTVETNKIEEADLLKSNESIQSEKSEKHGKFTTEVILENVTKSSDWDNDIKTIFEKKEKKREQSVLESHVKDCNVDILLSASDQKCPSALLGTSESESTDDKKNGDKIPSKFNVPDVTVNRAELSEVILPAEKPKELANEFCLQTEHLFRSERTGDFSGCISQEYNVAIIYNQNILQEFRGTFQPNKLELGSYEKLDLVPKYLDPDNITVRLEDCIVKMETRDQLYIRAKFLLKKIDVEYMFAKNKNEFYEGAKKSDLVVLNPINIKECDPSVNATKVEGQQLEGSVESKKKLDNYLELINKTSVSQKCEVISLKSPDTDLQKSSKNFVLDSPKQSSEVKSKKEKSENDSDEKSENDSDETNDKGVKNLFSKRKKTVYFTYEKVEKDVNSGKKIFVGSFRTKDGMRVLSKEKKLPKNIDNFFSFEKFVQNNEKRKFFLLPNKESDSEEVIRVENSVIDRDDSNIKVPSKSRNTDKTNSNKDLITLHKYKPKNLVENSKSERKNLSARDLDHTIKLDILLSKKSVKLQISEIDSSINKTQRYSPKMECQTGVIVIPVELHSLSKIELVVIEHPKNNRENNGKRKKEYIPCLNGYF